MSVANYYITLEKEGLKYSTFLLGYDKGGGYFISDLSQEKGSYFITRLKIKCQGFGQQLIPVDHKNEWITDHKPKLICHFDGSSQVSGTGVKSGFFKLTGKPKGVATKSPRFNDGGPIFGFVCWGLNKFPTNKNNNLVTFNITNMHTDPYLGLRQTLTPRKYDAYIFEGFYLPIQAIKYINIQTGIINFKHPNFGIIPLKYIPPPKNSPGFIAIGCRPTDRGFKTDHGITYGGGVSFADKEGYSTQIQLIFPFEGNSPDNGKKLPKKLNFDFKDKIISYLDDLLSWFHKN